MRYFARICAHARSWREFAKCRFAHFPSFFSVRVDTYAKVTAYKYWVSGITCHMYSREERTILTGEINYMSAFIPGA